MQPSDPSDTTRTQPLTELLLARRDGRAGVVDRLYPRVYEELRRIAHRALDRAMILTGTRSRTAERPRRDVKWDGA